MKYGIALVVALVAGGCWLSPVPRWDERVPADAGPADGSADAP